MCGHTLDFLSACAQEAALPGGGAPPPTLLELYCGNGNHTVALARFFSKILAVEIDRKLCDAAEFNLEQNGVGNGCVLCASSGNFCQGCCAASGRCASTASPRSRPMARRSAEKRRGCATRSAAPM